MSHAENRMNANLPHAARVLILSAAISALASCGGGGGGGGGPASPPTPVALNAGNEQPVTDDVLAVSLNFVSVGNGTQGGGIVPFSAKQRALPKTRLLVGLLRQQLGRLNPQRSPQSSAFAPADAADAVTASCDGGGTQTSDVDTGTTTFANCSSGGETINGTLTLTNIMQGTGSISGHVSHSLTIAQAGFPTLTSSGDFDVVQNTSGTVVTDTLTGGPITIQLDSDAASISSFTLISSLDSSDGNLTDSISGTIASTAMGGSVSVTTPTTFQVVGTSQFPNTGQLLITGAANSAVRFTVLGDETLAGNQVSLEVDPEGDGTFQAPVEMTWAAL
jgi:hypothetical protein